MGPREWREFLDQWFTVNRDAGIYLLGCHSQRVTLYSQQVRALNLVTALAETGEIQADKEVAVIGGGASGLMAAAAAAYRKAKVTVFESLEEPLALQRNSRQRWLHPHIYDWPFFEGKGDYTILPFLGWRAGYGESVASQIAEGWEQLLAQSKPAITRVRAKVKAVRKAEGGCEVEADHRTEPFHVAILAVGFGLEAEGQFSHSYWTDDDLDGGLRSLENERWLISGFGDGALTDLMRLCIYRFRHADVAGLFGSAPGIDRVKRDLREIVDGHANIAPDQQAAYWAAKFNGLETGGLEKALKTKLRELGPKVFLTGKTDDYYGPRASLLNRLILLVLRRLNKWEFAGAPAGGIMPIPETGEWWVELGQPKQPGMAKPRKKFNRIIQRHGPRAALADLKAVELSKPLADLKSRWDKLDPDKDKSRTKMWTPGYFGDEGSPYSRQKDVLALAHAKAVSDCGIHMKAFVLNKEIRSNGSSLMTFQVDGLEVLEGELSGLHIFLQFTAGHIGPPGTDGEADRLGLKWDPPDAQPPVTLPEAIQRACQFSGVLRFPEDRKLQPGTSVSFGFNFTILNGDALTQWEFEQLYKPDQRFHMNHDELYDAREYVALTVWCPVQTVKLQVTLPSGRALDPFATFFQCPAIQELKRDERRAEVFKDSILWLHPREDSKWRPKNTKWDVRTSGALVDAHHLRRVGTVWELSVEKPPVGSSCCLDWILPSSAPGGDLFQRIEQNAKAFRARLLGHGWLTSELAAQAKDILRGHFMKLAKSLYAEFGGERAGDEHAGGELAEEFEVSMVVYDDKDHRLELVAGMLNGEPFAWPANDGGLPFGMGSAGACFKDGENVYIYRRPGKDQTVTGPEFYLKLKDTAQHEILFSVPLDHPVFGDGIEDTNIIERARQGIGVVNIGSTVRNEQMLKLVRPEDFKPLRQRCQDFCDGLFKDLKPLIETTVLK